MDFFINKNATLPILKLELIQDGRNDFKKFFEKLQNSNIYFCMSDVVTGARKVGRKPAMCILKESEDDCCGEEYYLGYQFSERDTNTAGTYAGQFIIDFLDESGTLIVPIREELFIHVLDGSIKK